MLEFVSVLMLSIVGISVAWVQFPSQTKKENWSNQDPLAVVVDANATQILSAPLGSLSSIRNVIYVKVKISNVTSHFKQIQFL